MQSLSGIVGHEMPPDVKLKVKLAHGLFTIEATMIPEGCPLSPAVPKEHVNYVVKETDRSSVYSSQRELNAHESKDGIKLRRRRRATISTP
jgi:hypothetical protein